LLTVFPSEFINKDVHKPAQPPYLVVVPNDVIEYVEDKYKCTAEQYWRLAGQRRMVSPRKYC
jgi:hypothetical protein